MRIAKVLMLIVLLAACRQETTRVVQTASAPATNVGQEIRDRIEADAPLGRPATIEEIEQQRFDDNWRKLRSFQAEQYQRDEAAAQAAAQAAATPIPVQLTFSTDPKVKESMEKVDPAAVDSLPVRVPIKGDVSGPSVLRAQVFLDRLKYSPGIIDGRWGKNSEIAVYWFQREMGVPPTGEVDQATFIQLASLGGAPAVVQYALTAEDVKGPFEKIPEDVYEQEKLKCLCYESLDEKLAERFHTSLEFLQKMNAGVDLSAATEGQQLWVPNVRPPAVKDIQSSIVNVVVSVEGNYLHGLDGSGRVLFHAPTTLGSEYDPSPTETLEVKKVTFNPWFHYQPKLFHEVDDEEPEAHLAPGPNAPVGVVWAALSKPHYGIHGTSDPGSIGYASSHGCIRLTNWDAAELAHQLRPGMQVEFVDTRSEREPTKSQ